MNPLNQFHALPAEVMAAVSSYYFSLRQPGLTHYHARVIANVRLKALV